MSRNYRSEYDNYHGKPEQKKRRASRNTARRKAVQQGIIKTNDSRDIAHKDNNPYNNKLNNIIAQAQSKNRSFARTSTARRAR